LWKKIQALTSPIYFQNNKIKREIKKKIVKPNNLIKKNATKNKAINNWVKEDYFLRIFK
jgi:DNA-binding transcriptional regulator WhiA